jgi:MYXO-CTERM domain-containing protein
MKEVYKYVEANADLTSLATNRTLPSMVVVYPGAEIAKVWATGLWPHAGEGGYTTSEGVRIVNVFITNAGTRTTIDVDTMRHELGHSLFDWPDTYDYDDDSAGAGGFATETTLPCAVFRANSGWMNVIDIVGLNQAFSLPANGDTCLRYKNASNANEYFMLEYMKKESPKRANAPDDGLLIWHVDERGDNNAQDMTATKHYQLSVEQADGLFELEKNGKKRTNDLFHAGNKDRFDATTTPNSKWWNGSASGLTVCDIGPLDPAMAVTIGCSGPIEPAQISDGGIPTGGAMDAGSSGTGGRSGIRDAGRDGVAMLADAAVDGSVDAPRGGTGGRGGSTGTGGTTGATTGGSGGSTSASGGSSSGGTSSSTATSSRGGSDSASSRSSSAGGSGGSSSSKSSSAGGSSASSSASQSSAAADKSGCSCALAARSSERSSLGLFGLLALALSLARRRSSRRQA